jgi:Ca2+-binding EF-hand superfamily protein
MDEFVLMVESLGLGFSPDEVRQLQNCLDKDYDGTVDMDEFVTSAPQLLQVVHL